MKKATILLAFVLITLLVGCGTGGDSSTTGTTGPDTANWQTVFVLSGNGNQQSALFYLNAEYQSMVYNLEGDNPVFTAYVIPQGRTADNIDGNGTLATVAAADDRPGSREIILLENRPPGYYYLEVNSDCTWQVTIKQGP
jgi:hypothetical protein